MSILAIVIWLIIAGVLFWAVKTLGAAFSIPAPIITVIIVILVLVIVLYIANGLLGSGGLSLPPLR